MLTLNYGNRFARYTKVIATISGDVCNVDLYQGDKVCGVLYIEKRDSDLITLSEVLSLLEGVVYSRYIYAISNNGGYFTYKSTYKEVEEAGGSMLLDITLNLEQVKINTVKITSLNRVYKMKQFDIIKITLSDVVGAGSIEKYLFKGTESLYNVCNRLLLYISKLRNSLLFLVLKSSIGYWFTSTVINSILGLT